ncbi:MAG: hypothetical protein KAY24_01170 [Candidatus Eisenbacteria sp.]|nr:hypothetical protein [Candidatus Eisenbacteria bacterium]
MENPERGIVTLEAGDKEYRIKLGWNAICSIEHELGKTMTEIFEQMEASFCANDFRILLQAALSHGEKKRYQPGDVGDIIDEAGIDAVSRAISEAVKYAFPSKGSAKEGDSEDAPAEDAEGN